MSMLAITIPCTMIRMRKLPLRNALIAYARSLGYKVITRNQGYDNGRCDRSTKRIYVDPHHSTLYGYEVTLAHEIGHALDCTYADRSTNGSCLRDEKAAWCAAERVISSLGHALPSEWDQVKVESMSSYQSLLYPELYV